MSELRENQQFWEQAWSEGRTRFHRDQVNSTLIEHATRLFGHGARVLVPLCGKSLDLLWLTKQGFGVNGVEIAKQALEEFISENHLEGVWEHKRYQVKGQRLALYCEDFFHHDGKYDAIYDRACYVALKPELRARMAERYRSLLMPGGKILLLTLQHNSGDGPPFSITDEEIHRAFGQNFQIKLLNSYQDGERTVYAHELVLI